MTKTQRESILKHFEKHDPLISAVMKDLDFALWLSPQEQKRNSDGYFGALCRSIIGQQLSTKVADVIHGRFISLFTKEPLTPEAVLAIPDEQLRGLGISWSKIAYIKDLAHKVLSEELPLEKIETLSDEEVITTLTKVKGIGQWTGEMFLIFTLHREDIFSHGDLGLKRGIEKLYALTDPQKEAIELIINKWSPYKAFGSIALWHSLDISETDAEVA